MALIDVLNDAVSGLKGTLGVSVKHLETGETASINGGDLFPTASVFKVPVIIEFFRQLESKTVSLDEKKMLAEADKVPGSGILKELSNGLELTYGDLLRLMMILSDNTATDLVIKRVGKDRVNATKRSHGLEETKVVADSRDILFDLIGLGDLPDEEKTLALFTEKAQGTTLVGTWSLGVDENDVTTPSEMLRLLEMIVEGKAASRESCNEIMEIMSKCQTGGNRIPKYLPRAEMELTHKTGSLPGIRNDAGLVTIQATGERYILSCFIKGAADVYAAEETIAMVSKSVYKYFTK
ncbi:MAG: serine hydrolase [Candidatus Bathyarchaeota archaeon]|nr:serine hydrolase [Candidatus Bathyarchaeota archaeon]